MFFVLPKLERRGYFREGWRTAYFWKGWRRGYFRRGRGGVIFGEGGGGVVFRRVEEGFQGGGRGRSQDSQNLSV